MAKCDGCGNDYDKTLEITLGGRALHFDCFECAIRVLAPECARCGVKIIGHGVEGRAAFYCCAHCARQAGEGSLRDRSGGEQAAE